MSGFEVAGLVLGIMGLVPIFKEGHRLVQSYRQSRRISLPGFMTPRITALEKETWNGGTAIETRYQGFVNAYGDAFASGDGKYKQLGLCL